MQTLKARLAARKKTYGMWLDFGSPSIAEAAVYAGFGLVLIDNEHGPASLETTLHMLRAVQAAGGEAIVRVPANDPVYLKRLLELGVRNVLIPAVDSAEQAEAAVRACRYPPLGRRGYAASIVRGSRYGMNPDYAATAHEDLCLMLQIESLAAVEQAAAIAAVDGVDMLFIGPNDLAGSMGLLERLDHLDLRAKMRAVEQAAQLAGAGLGCIPLPNEDARALFDAGYDLILGASDVALATGAFRGAADAFRAELDFNDG